MTWGALRGAQRAGLRTVPRQRRLGTQSGLAAFLATGPSSWYDTRDLLTSSQQTLTNRVGTSTATLGSTSGSDTNDPVALTHDGTNYVYLPGTASNNLSIPKDGGWAGTLHVTATLTDDTTATFTTTASPILIGNTLLSAGRYKRFDVRDTDGSGTLRVTINLVTETLGQASFTCTTGQTVTVNRATSGLTTAVVTRPLLATDGTDDYLQLPAGDTPTFTATTGAYTVMLVNRVHNLAGAGTQSRVWSSEPNFGGLGAFIYLDATNAQYKVSIGDGTTTVLGANAAVFTQTTQLHAVAAVFDAGSVAAYSPTTGLVSGTSYGGLGAITHNPPRVGTRGFNVSSSADMETHAVAHWRRALTAAELATASAYLLGSYA